MANSEQKKAQALTALMDSGTLTAAAEKAGISRRTLYAYIHEDMTFARAYKEAQAQAAIEQLDGISEARQQATGVIAGIMQDEKQPAAVRLKAAQSVFTISEAYQKRAEGIIADNVERTAPLFEPF